MSPWAGGSSWQAPARPTTYDFYVRGFENIRIGQDFRYKLGSDRRTPETSLQSNPLRSRPQTSNSSHSRTPFQLSPRRVKTDAEMQSLVSDNQLSMTHEFSFMPTIEEINGSSMNGNMMGFEQSALFLLLVRVNQVNNCSTCMFLLCFLLNYTLRSYILKLRLRG